MQPHEGVTMKTRTTIQKWGNSLAIRISGPLKSIPGFAADMVVEVDVNENELTIRRINLRKKKLGLFSEAQLLEEITAKNVHADEIADIGDEEF
jgi:antitoxin MazE